MISPKPSQTEPRVAGMRVRPALPMALYGLLAASAGLAMWSQRAPEAPPAVAMAAPWVFLGFAVGFSAYRLALVMAGHYPAFKAFMQILFAALFFVLLLFPGLEAVVVAPRETAPLEVALLSRDPLVRALSAELAGWRGEIARGPQLARLLEDPAPAVRQAAHAALVRLSGGQDLGLPDSPGAVKAWRDRFP